MEHNNGTHGKEEDDTATLKRCLPEKEDNNGSSSSSSSSSSTTPIIPIPIPTPINKTARLSPTTIIDPAAATATATATHSPCERGKKGTLDVLFLGTGVSIAVPNMNHILQGDCAVCGNALANPESKDRRCNVSVAVLVNGTGEGEDDTNRDCILIDAGKTMREAILRQFPKEGIKRVQALLLTHDHADATFGLDDLRDLQKKEHEPQEDGLGIRLVDPPIEVYLQEATFATIKDAFKYLVSTTPWLDKAKRLLLRNVPVLDWKPLASNHASLSVTSHKVPVQTFPVHHGGEYVSLGFSIGKPGAFVYISDVKKIPEESLLYLKSLPTIDVLVLDCISVQKDMHYSHYNLGEALTTVDDLKPRQCFLTGMCCDVGPHNEMNEKLRQMGYPQVALAWDGMVVRGVEM